VWARTLGDGDSLPVKVLGAKWHSRMLKSRIRPVPNCYEQKVVNLDRMRVIDDQHSSATASELSGDEY
jgi:hypothetical protein